MSLYLIRHAQITYPGQNDSEVCHGQIDTGFSAPINRQTLAKALRKGKPDCIVSSDLLRCRLLAEELARDSGIQVEFDPRWRELDFGNWENRSWSEIRKEDPLEFECWVKDFVHEAPHGGESFFALQRRVSQTMEEYRNMGHVLVITHAGPIRAALCFSLGLPLARAFELAVPFESGWFFELKDKNWQLVSPDLNHSIANREVVV
ncbi:MAG: alpha-ribazole phosphatase family protein [Verrucomicrobia bacterium]|nr:alpha-ribazole phosphatase family protein [Verrucomicrobiota bacterium]